ncbi:MAG: glycosyltransferase [Saprospiraceae bacterium]|nr:glycosyltransferase [Saprospiraceae bacterium]
MEQKTEHIYWFAPYNLSCPSTRYRGKLPLEYLRKHKQITFDFFYPQRSFAAYFKFLFLWIKICLFRKKNSKIYIQKICSNRLYAKALKLLISIRSKQTVYDIDDAEYLRQDDISLHFFLKKCSLIHVGSQALYKYCSAHNTNIKIITSPVFKHKFQKRKRNDVFTIGWVGDLGNGKTISKNFAHKTSIFTLLFPALKKLNIPLRLILIGVKKESDIPEIKDYFKDLPHISLEIPFPLFWEEDLWLYQEIVKFDVGVSPLVKHPFNEAKSAFKAKQYLSCGVPTIASDVGENNNYVLHKKNGWLCSSIDSFTNAISVFANMQEEVYLDYVHNALEGFDSFSFQTYTEALI